MISTLLSKVPYEEGVVLKTKRDLKRLSYSGRCVGATLSRVSSEIKAGVSTNYLEEVCRAYLSRECGESRVEKVEDFPTYLSVSVNDVAVHGVPSSYLLRGGDVVTIDLAVRIDGWYGDAAVTVPVGTASPDTMRLIKAARKATDSGIASISAGGRFGDIAAGIGCVADRAGYRIIENLAGHGVGEKLHEAPTVLQQGEEGVGAPIVPGMVFTVEPVLTAGEPVVVESADGYGLVTRDGERTALFEHTVAVTSEGVHVLTDVS